MRKGANNRRSGKPIMSENKQNYKQTATETNTRNNNISQELMTNSKTARRTIKRAGKRGLLRKKQKMNKTSKNTGS